MKIKQEITMKIKFRNEDSRLRAVTLLVEIYKGVKEPVVNNGDGTFTITSSMWDTLKYLGYEFSDVVE
jgi:hypothetical protein